MLQSSQSEMLPHPQAVANAISGLSAAPLTFNIVVQKAKGVGLGISVAHSSIATNMKGMLVGGVHPGGVIAAWNEGSEEPKRVHPGDLIFQVNGVYGDTMAMIDEVKAKKFLAIHVMRIPGGEGLTIAPPDGGQVLSNIDALASRLRTLEQAEKEDRGGRAAELEGEQWSEANPEDQDAGASSTAAPGRRRFSPRVEALLPKLAAMSDEALASFLAVTLENRPELRDRVLRRP
uniref:PDZ domain-containing protein n=1 Tax=Alexandrium catenella TaxID=2925 RepID=A0A7S1QDB3_ALECA|mmetsp:Transcript_26253/g.71346  ORF Transcript_26253/g.71346 Transcript_26253/m.71346 type:complete len:233 (+) Transcript_26253:57-755(+)